MPDGRSRAPARAHRSAAAPPVECIDILGACRRRAASAVSHNADDDFSVVTGPSGVGGVSDSHVATVKRSQEVRRAVGLLLHFQPRIFNNSLTTTTAPPPRCGPAVRLLAARRPRDVNADC